MTIDPESVIGGVVIGVVTSNQDPAKLSRVQVQYPWLDGVKSNWARVAALSAGPGRGTYFLPQIGDEVLIAFELGDVASPFVIGSLWNGKDLPPGDPDTLADVRTIKTKGGSVVRFDDTEGKEKIEIVDAKANKIAIDSSAKTITITSTQDGAEIAISAPQGKVSINAKTIEVKATSTLVLSGKSGVNVEASAETVIKGRTIRLN